MPVFTDSEPKQFEIAPDGDYVLCCTEFKIGIATGAKIAGCEKYETTLEIEDREGRTIGRVWENMFDHPSCAWKLDCWLKAGGVRDLKRGEAYSFREDEAAAKFVRWVDPIGLRCPAKLGHEEYTGKDGQKRVKNVVMTFYTDRTPLPRRVIEVKKEARPF